MWELTIQTVTLAAVLAILGLCSYAFVRYIRLLHSCCEATATSTHVLRRLRQAARKMECGDLINQLWAETESAGAAGRCTTLEREESAGAARRELQLLRNSRDRVANKNKPVWRQLRRVVRLKST